MSGRSHPKCGWAWATHVTKRITIFFHASTVITIGNGAKTPFWDAPWVHGQKPKDIAPFIHEASTRKNWKVKEALNEGAWISIIKMTINFTMAHIHQFVELWMLISEFPLKEHAEDEISWKNTTDGQYSAASAYSVQFFETFYSPMDHTVWKAWALPKVKFFVWLAIQDQIWTVDGLARRGWPNCHFCPLCKRKPESELHLFVKCRFTLRLWNLANEWLNLDNLDTSTWHLQDSIKDWWVSQSSLSSPNRKAMASLTMLIGCTIWNERNASIFRIKSMPTPILLNSIKSEALTWVTVGAKKLGTITPGE